MEQAIACCRQCTIIQTSYDISGDGFVIVGLYSFDAEAEHDHLPALVKLQPNPRSLGGFLLLPLIYTWPPQYDMILPWAWASDGPYPIH